MRTWFAHRKSTRSAFFSAIFYDLRSLHPRTCLNTKTPRAFRWKRAFCTWISKFASFWLCFEQANWTRPRKKQLGTRLILSLPRVIRSINVQYLPHPRRDTSPQSITRSDSGFRRQTCEKLWYLNIYLGFARENLFSYNICFSPVILKGIIPLQSSQNETLRYSPWNFATPNLFMIRFAVSFTVSLPLR